MPEKPSAEDIEVSRALLVDELLVDFPFVDYADRAHAVAAFLLPFARRMIPGCTPLHLVEAPSCGSGKGLLCNLISLVATGTVCEARTVASNEDDIRKMITSELLTERPLVLLDNLGKRVDSVSLASVLTAERWTDRLLGKSQMLSLRNRVMWLLTANNPDLSMEVARRSIRIRLDAKSDRPWQRQKFRHKEILAWAAEHRPALVHAVLVLIQAWLAAGKPQHTTKLGSFEPWSAIVGGILQVAGIESFLDNLETLYEDADAEGQLWREFVAAWSAKHGSNPVKPADLNQLCETQSLMDEVRGFGTERSKQTKLGRALQRAKDRVIGGFKIVQKKDSKGNSSVYGLVEVPKGGNQTHESEKSAVSTESASAPAKTMAPKFTGPQPTFTGPHLDLGPVQKCLKNEDFCSVTGLSGPFTPHRNPMPSLSSECLKQSFEARRVSIEAEMGALVGKRSSKSSKSTQVPINKGLNTLDLGPVQASRRSSMRSSIPNRLF